MRRIKVLVDFLKLPVAGKLAFYRNVLLKMKAATEQYPNPDVALESVQTLVDTLERKMLAATDGGHAATVAMHDAENNADDAFRLLAAYIERIARGDEMIILEAGFTPSRQPSPKNKAELAAYDGDNSGSVMLVARAIEGAKAYVWQRSVNVLPADEKGWDIFSHTTGSTNEETGLTPGSKVYYRVAGITINGLTDYTAPVRKLVQ